VGSAFAYILQKFIKGWLGDLKKVTPRDFHALIPPSEPEFVNLLRSPEIDSQIPGKTTLFDVPDPHEATWAGRIDSSAP
jgi:hypothetical protein